MDKQLRTGLNNSLLAALIVFSAWLAAPAAIAQSETAATSDPAATSAIATTDDSAQAQAVRRLLAIKQALDDKRERLRELLTQLQSADEIDEPKIRTRIAELRATIDSLTRSFETIAVNGASLGDLDDQSQPQLSWHDELMQVARPLLNSLKEATAKPRRIEELRREIELYEQQFEVTRRAIAALALFETRELPPGVAQGLASISSSWQERSRDIEHNLGFAIDELQALEAQDIDLVATLVAVGQEFFLGRGLTLLIALLTGLGLWFAMRLLRRLLGAGVKPRQDAEHAARLRLLLYGYHLLTLILVSLGILSVFYARGDLLLLSLSIIALAMLALGAWRHLPSFMREARLLLNIGTARQGERVIYQGLPFQITEINLYSELRNPELDGVIRLPLAELAQLISRPPSDEAWFPCRAGDYLLLADGSFVHVLRQGIDWVELKSLGSIQRIRSADFLQQGVRNISLEGFSIAATFGIDYQHQSIALTEVPARLREGLEAAFAGAEFGADLKDLQVDFCLANASSLDYLVYATMEGNSAASYFAIQRLIQQTCVATCEQQGWVIPFDQLTVHPVEATPAKA